MQVPKPSTCTVRRKIEFEASFSIKGQKISNDVFYFYFSQFSPKRNYYKKNRFFGQIYFSWQMPTWLPTGLPANQYGSDFIRNGRIFLVLRQCLVVFSWIFKKNTIFFLFSKFAQILSTYCFFKRQPIQSYIYESWFISRIKGQLISKCLLDVIVSTKKPTKIF